MARCKECLHYEVCAKEGRLVQVDEHTWDNYNVLDDVEHFCTNYFTADVVPKSEVVELENKLRPLEDKLRQYEQICGKLAIKYGVAVGLIDGKETVYISKGIAKVTKELAIRRTRQEVAREIFEEIEHAIDYAEIEWGTIFGVKCSIAAVKKKYTDGAKTKEIGKFVAPKVVQLTIDDMENNQ